jgi:hypothetical protein
VAEKKKKPTVRDEKGRMSDPDKKGRAKMKVDRKESVCVSTQKGKERQVYESGDRGKVEDEKQNSDRQKEGVPMAGHAY